MNSFQTFHSLQILNSYCNKLGALDKFVSLYIRANKSIGSKDRAKIHDCVYKSIRFSLLFDHFIEGNKSWESRLEVMLNNSIERLQSQLPIENGNRYGINTFFMKKLIESLGIEEALIQANIINSKAPVFIRANTIKTSAYELINILPKELNASFSTNVNNCLKLEKRANLFSLDEFKMGFFEMQDEGAQIICEKIPVREKDLIIDYCSGSGGKSLAIAPRMKNSGQIFLHDIRTKALIEAKKRLKRAGVENAQILPSNHSQLRNLKNKADLVLADVPCSGSGVIRRNPESRIRINQEYIAKLVETQRSILHTCSSLTKKNGLIAYITCSLINDENIFQVDWFLNNYNFKIFIDPVTIKPSINGNDGFFLTIFQKN